MPDCIYNTDPDWIKVLSTLPTNQEVNFWRQDKRILHLKNGDYFYFKLRSENYIIGRAQFLNNILLTIDEAWERFGKFNVTFLYGFYAPTGKYETGSSDNIGIGFWTNQFQGYGYYYPFQGKSTAIMLGLTYELNSKIKDADVTPGNRFTLEWGISQFLSDQFEVGIQGGHNWQVSDDTGNDVYWDSSVHDRKSTFAFNASYWPWKERLMINLTYAFDYGCVQRFKNNSWNVNLIFVTNLLTGE